jgi:hypothetical protein
MDCPPPHTIASDKLHLADEGQQADRDKAYREGEGLELFHLQSP